jgi:hypothetical protein
MLACSYWTLHHTVKSYRADYFDTNSTCIIGLKKDLKTTFWIELESWLKLYQDSSERHKILYSHTKIIRDQLLKAQNVDKSSNKKLDLDSYKKVKTNDYLEQTHFHKLEN